MEKRLKKYTTIPGHLYVNRDADLQLKKIVEDMQRPGYVLVARQMGKTNLLLNAKRVLENDRRLFAYVDLSNLYDHERECYRNIVNSIIEPNQTLLEKVEGSIEQIRCKDLPPHNEFTRSLVSILNAYDGDLVVILDEIDALKSVPYSDNIFAQIRSNYFSRTSYPVFERLTYILSGVIEPTELIKDANKSPFNIGDKIYLDDFTKKEHDDFIRMSGLDLDQAVADGIFDWTNGNPRLTFDICSDVEGHLTDLKCINTDQLNQLVVTKYLTTFDIAPVDHIRDLVRSSKAIRKAISLIRKGRSMEISDEIKKRLYLFGIINSKFNEPTKIKNKIIDFSLSDDWIRSVDRLTSDNFSLGLEKIDAGDYYEGIQLLLEFLANAEASKSQTDICNYNIGFSYYKLGDFENAVKYFSLEYKADQYIRNSKSLRGISFIAIGEIDTGIEILEEIIADNYNDYAYRNALLNLSRQSRKIDKERALSLLTRLYDSTFDPVDEVPSKDLMQLRALALYYQVTNLTDNIELALKKIDEAIECSSKSDSLYLIYLKGVLIGGSDNFTKRRLVENIICHDLMVEEEQSYPISFTYSNILKFVDYIFDEEDDGLFVKLIGHISRSLVRDRSEGEIIYDASIISSGNRTRLLFYLLQRNEPDEMQIKIYRDLALLNSSKPKTYFDFFERFHALFTKQDIVIAEDVYLFALGIKLHSDIGKLKRALELCEVMERRFSESFTDELKFEFTIIFYWFAILYSELKDKTKSLKYATIALDLLNISSHRGTSMMDEKGLHSIEDTLLTIRKSSMVNKPIVVGRKYGRNDKVKVKFLDGRIVEKKYKHLESDLLAERCKILN